MIGQKIRYLLRSIYSSNQKKQCPNCSCNRLHEVDSKYIVTKLLKCDRCKLNFRYPVDSPDFLNSFYQTDYKADYSDVTAGITSLPTDDELSVMMASNFVGRRDYSPFVIALLKSSRGKIVDFGASWGYSVFQLKNAGFDSAGFEISRSRAEFGKKLNVKIHSRYDEVDHDLDMIASSHTIEHLLRISDLIEFSRERLKSEGLLMAFCPNGSPEFRNREPESFHVNWGFLHPNYLDVEFAMESFKNNPYLILTADWDFDIGLLHSWDQKSQIVGTKRDGNELLIIAKPNQTI